MIASLGAGYAEIAAETCFTSADFPPIHKILLCDELVNQMGRLELRRRAAVVDGEKLEAETIGAWQQVH